MAKKEEKGVCVEFLENYGGYVKGDVAVFCGVENEKLAKELVKLGIAQKR